MTGGTESNDFPVTPDAIQAARAGSSDVFLARLSAGGDALEFSTYLGGNSNDGAAGVAIGADGDAYLAGSTRSTNFPTTPGAYDTTYNTAPFRPAFSDGFVTRITGFGPGPPTTLDLTPARPPTPSAASTA